MRNYVRWNGHYFKVVGNRSVVIYNRYEWADPPVWVIRMGTDNPSRRGNFFFGRAEGYFETTSLPKAKRIGDKWLDGLTVAGAVPGHIYLTPDQMHKGMAIVQPEHREVQ